ncbi:MAG: hypothetical protein A2X77_02545 [Gammaproteobacteria bacterium GWE2_42_36]|nr:MAG: hypothetical protein A2X77_02545 [Gammaproteobacteria bacterium GWE2_42_36]HCU04873.1 hypothetical protein [Coxiellaceae bacterium]
MLTQKNRHYFILYLTVVTVSLALSAISIYHYPVFNPDGLRYFAAANAYVSQGFSAAFGPYNWPFYSILLVYLSKLSGLTLLQSAYFLNIIFSLGIVLVFIEIIRLFTPSIKMLWLAALVILICHQFNANRYAVIRDQGYWFFYLLSILFLIRYVCQDRWLYSIGWSLSLLISFLFRIEGAVFLLAVPLGIFTLPQLSWKKRLTLYVKLNVPLLIYLAILFGALWHWHLYTVEHSSRLYELYYKRPHAVLGTANGFSQRLAAVKQFILPPEGSYDAGAFLLLGAVGVFLWHLVSQYTLTFSFLTVYAIFYGLITHRIVKNILLNYLVVSLILLIFFYEQSLFLADRYVMGISFVFLLFVPFGLADLYQRWRMRPRTSFSIHHVLFPLICVGLLSMAVSSVHRFGHSKIYQYQASQWMKSHIPASASVCVDDGVMAYLSNRPTTPLDIKTPQGRFDIAKIQRAPWRHCDYVSIIMDGEQKSLEQLLIARMGTPILSFQSGYHQAQVAIFKINQ